MEMNLIRGVFEIGGYYVLRILIKKWWNVEQDIYILAFIQHGTKKDT